MPGQLMRESAAIPYEVEQMMARRLFARLQPKEADDALGHGEVGDVVPDSGSNTDSGDGNRHRSIFGELGRQLEEMRKSLPPETTP